MELSVIIANLNGKDLIGNCLKSLKEHINGIQYETIVIDNGSSDGSAEFIRKSFPEVILICNFDGENIRQRRPWRCLSLGARYVAEQRITEI